MSFKNNTYIFLEYMIINVNIGDAYFRHFEINYYFLYTI